jgi:hypothetical protein
VSGQITPKPRGTPWEGEAPAEPPECSTVLRLSRSFALPLWPTSRASVPRWLPASRPLPHGRGLWLTAWGVGRHCQVAHVKIKGTVTPHPRPLSPSRGEGCQVRFPLQLKHTNSSPRPRNGGEGPGVSGQITPKPRDTPWEGEAPAEPPECSTVLRLSRSFALPMPAATQVAHPPGNSGTRLYNAGL